MKVLGLIPARAGSKGIPNKNSKLLDGKPLLAYTVSSALEAKNLDAVIFSSEDETLIEIAREYGASCPFKRPEHLATDRAGSLDVVIHAVTALQEEGMHFDAVCLLQVTNPFRTSSQIDKAIEKFKSANTDSLISVLTVPHEFNPHWVFESSPDGHLRLATGEDEIIKRRQDLPPAYIRDGAIYIVKTEVLLNQKSLYGNSIAFIESDPERHVNIDTMSDWQLAEELVKKLKD
jgi:CMP-N-acetylneuraminic acid synthetase